MPKTAVSVTLETANLMWLKARSWCRGGLRSVSELLDQLVTAARASGGGPVRSVVGTVDISTRQTLDWKRRIRRFAIWWMRR